MFANNANAEYVLAMPANWLDEDLIRAKLVNEHQIFLCPELPSSNDHILNNINFKIDDEGIPLYSAPGNTPDITCQYKNFEMIVEVTMSSGQKQYEMEGEPVARHLGNYKKTTDKDVYCLFIAPQLNRATIAHYYLLYRSNIDYYGGQAKIIPLSLNDFKVMLGNANKAKVKPNSATMKQFMEDIANIAMTTNNENEWQEKTSAHARSAFLE